MTDDIPMQISAVPAEFIPQVWEDVRPFIAESADFTNGRYEEEDAYHLVTQMGYVLWIAFNGSGIKGATITGFINYPRKKALHVMFLGGGSGWDWKDPLLVTLRRWATDNHCDCIEASGRQGWARVFKDDGFTPLWQTFELPLKTSD